MIGAAHPLGQDRGRRLEPHHLATMAGQIAKQVAVGGIEHHSAGGRDHGGFGPGQGVAQRGPLLEAKGGFAVGLEDLAHGATGAGLDLLIAVEEGQAQRFGHALAHRRLARAHHPHQHHVGLDPGVGRGAPTQLDRSDVQIGEGLDGVPVERRLLERGGRIGQIASGLQIGGGLHLGQEPGVVAHQLHHRVAAELAQHLVGQHQRHHRLGHHSHGGHGGHVGPLAERHGLGLGHRVDRRQRRTVQGGQGLHGHVGHQQLARAHPALHAPGAGGVAAVGPLVGIPANGVVGLAPPSSGHAEAVAQLDALDRLDAHERLRQQGVELAIPVDVAAQPDGQAVAQHLDHAAQRIALGSGGLDLGHHGRLGAGVEASHLRVVDPVEVARGGTMVGAGADRPEGHHVGHHLDADGCPAAPWPRPRRPHGPRSPGRRPARARLGRR